MKHSYRTRTGQYRCHYTLNGVLIDVSRMSSELFLGLKQTGAALKEDVPVLRADSYQEALRVYVSDAVAAGSPEAHAALRAIALLRYTTEDREVAEMPDLERSEEVYSLISEHNANNERRRRGGVTNFQRLLDLSSRSGPPDGRYPFRIVPKEK